MSFICLFPERPRIIDDMKKFGCECHWIKYNSRYRKTQLIIGTWRLFWLLLKLKPDIIHSHVFDDSLISLIAAKIAGVKKRFITKADTGFHYFYTPHWIIFDKLNNRLATHIIAISTESQKFIIEKEKADPHKVYLIHHGIPIDKLTEQNTTYRTGFIIKWRLESKIVIGVIARYIDWKGYKDIISAAEKLVPEYPNILFLFIGNGDQKKELEKLVSDKNLHNNITFIGWIEPKRLPSLYGLMNVYVHAAKYEPFGLVIPEALANAIPVVSTKTGAALDAIEHKKSGYLCEYDPNDIANGVRFMLNQNPENIIGREGKKVAEKLYSIERMYSNHLKLYKETFSYL